MRAARPPQISNGEFSCTGGFPQILSEYNAPPAPRKVGRGDSLPGRTPVVCVLYLSTRPLSSPSDRNNPILFDPLAQIGAHVVVSFPYTRRLDAASLGLYHSDRRTTRHRATYVVNSIRFFMNVT